MEELRAALERFDSGDPNPAIPPGRGVATLRGDRTAAASCSSRAGIDDGAPLTCDADMTRCVSNSSVLLLDRTPEGGHFIRAVVDYEGEAPSEESRATRAVLARRDRICEGTDALLRGDPAPLRQGLWDLGLVSINENARPRRTAVETEVQAWVGEHLPHTGDDEPYGISHHCGPRVAAELHSIVQGELITCSEDRCSIGMEGNSSSAVMLGRSESGELRVLVSALTMSGDVSPSQFRALAQHVAPLVCP